MAPASACSLPAALSRHGPRSGVEVDRVDVDRADVVAHVRAVADLVQRVAVWRRDQRRRGQGLVEQPLVGVAVVDHVAVTWDAQRRRRQQDDILGIGADGAAVTVVDHHDLATVRIAAHAAQHPARRIGVGHDADAAGAVDDVDEVVAAALAPHVVAEVAESLVLVVDDEAAAVLLHDGAARLADEHAVALAHLAPLAADVLEPVCGGGGDEAPREARSRRSGDGARPIVVAAGVLASHAVAIGAVSVGNVGIGAPGAGAPVVVAVLNALAAVLPGIVHRLRGIRPGGVGFGRIRSGSIGLRAIGLRACVVRHGGRGGGVGRRIAFAPGLRLVATVALHAARLGRVGGVGSPGVGGSLGIRSGSGASGSPAVGRRGGRVGFGGVGLGLVHPAFVHRGLAVLRPGLRLGRGCGIGRGGGRGLVLLRHLGGTLAPGVRLRRIGLSGLGLGRFRLGRVSLGCIGLGRLAAFGLLLRLGAVGTTLLAWSLVGGLGKGAGRRRTARAQG